MADSKSNSPGNQDRLPARASFEARDLPVILLCLLGAAFCFGMFWVDLNRTVDRFAEPIGTITYKRQAAQRRFTDRVLWVRLSKGAPVYQKDYIRTAELSQATMHFKDGADIDLAENTLIQLRIENGKNVVDLSAGNLSVAVSGDARAVHILVSGENRVEIGPGAAINALAGASGGFSLQVLEGKVTANGKTFGPGEGFSTGTPAPRAAPLSPRPDTYVFASGGTATLRFSWSALNYSGPTIFELAPDRRFRFSEKKSLANGEESLLVNLSPGVYWWRVYPERSAGQGLSDALPEGTVARKITVVPPVSPELISPADGQYFYPETEIRFFWTSGALPPEIQDTGNYILELSDNPAFKTPLVSFNVEGTGSGFLVYSHLKEGVWYWRVRQLFSGVELAAVPRRFTVASTPSAAETGPPPETPPEPETTPAPQSETTTGVAVSDFPASRDVFPDTPPASLSLLPPPSGMDPPDRFTIGPEMIRRNRQLVFSWNVVEGADTYVFSLFEENAMDFAGSKTSDKIRDSLGTSGSGEIRNSGRLSLLLNVETTETSYILEDMGLLGRASGGRAGPGGMRGSFVWQVEAVVRNGIERHGTPGKSRFTLDVPAPGNPRVRETGTLYGF